MNLRESRASHGKQFSVARMSRLLSILPTGSGKSLIYQACTDIADKLASRSATWRGFKDKDIVLVVTLLVATIKTLELQNLGVKAINLADDEISVNDETENMIFFFGYTRDPDQIRQNGLTY